MAADPEVLNIEQAARGGPDASWLYRRRPTAYPEYLDRNDADEDEWAKWHADRADVDKILARAGMFHGVETSAVSALTKQLQPVDFPRGHTVFAEGEPGDRLFIIISGKVKIGRRSPDGRENLLTIMGPSDMFGELSIFDPGPRTSSATTITEVRAVSMDRDALRAWIADRPEIAEQLLRVLARRLRRTNNNLADLIFTDVPGRVAKQLLQLAQRIRHPGGRRAAGDARPHPGGDRSAGRRVARDRQQGARRFRPPRLDPLARQGRADLRLRTPRAPRALTGIHPEFVPLGCSLVTRIPAGWKPILGASRNEIGSLERNSG